MKKRKLNYIKSLWLIYSMLFLSTYVFAVDGNHRDFSPKTPEAAAFQQIGDIPVGNYTAVSHRAWHSVMWAD